MNRVTDHSPLLPVWYEAAKDLGYTVNDPNGPQKEGKYYYHVFSTVYAP